MPSLVIRPGAFVRLKGQPEDWPDFLVVHCSGDRCWVRQRDWQPRMQLHILTTQIAIPSSTVS
ncbi:MAG: hypothetical protein AAF215_02825 [Cyanobacteria bacterium P01_A01_bin.123]